MNKQSPTNINAVTGLVEGTFGIGTFEYDGVNFPAIVKPDGAIANLSDMFVDTHAIFDDWARAFDKLVDVAARNDAPNLYLQQVKPMPPVRRPNLLCGGANYRQHVAEMMTYNRFNAQYRRDGESDADFFQRNLDAIDRRSREGMPFFWTGLHSSLVGANDDIILPVVGEQHDWELELAAVLGGTGRHLYPEEAEKLVAGYVVVNDIGTVSEFRRSDLNWGFDWISKSQPSFKPAGPFIVPAAFVSLGDDVRIKLKVNGITKQDWPVTDMIFDIAKLLSYASERVRLMPGDMLLTGSPPGNGAFHGQFLKDGDIIESSITYLGSQRNICVQENIGNRNPVWGSFNRLTQIIPG